MSFKITILGSGAALPTNKRGPSAQYIDCINRHLLIDCGEGTQTQLRKFGVHFQKISHIFISHLHGDHFFGLPGLLSTMNLLGRNTGLTIYGPENLHALLNDIFSCGGQQLNFNLNFVPLDFTEEKVLFEDKLICVKSFPLKHRVPTCGFKIEEKTKEYSINAEATKKLSIPLKDYPKLKRGENIVLENGTKIDFRSCVLDPKKSHSYAYCSDTYPSNKYLNSIEKVDLLYHEATFTEKEADRAKATMHSTAKQAATIAQKAGVGRLLLGHLSARFDGVEAHLKEARPLFENVVVVSDFDVVEI